MKVVFDFLFKDKHGMTKMSFAEMGFVTLAIGGVGFLLGVVLV